MKVRAYITHKQAEKYSDCADYFGICPLNKRVAVSDGVSQSIMPLEWAKILVNAFINNSWDPETGVSSLQSEWFKGAIAYLNDQRAQGKNPWMLENCITNRDGAGATFCGIEFVDDSRWTAKILGDSCLVLLDKNNEIVKIISSKDGKFDNRPDYFDSFKEQRGTVKTEKGELKGHKILLVSDPFSELFQNYQTSVEIKVIIDRILSLNGYNSYVQLVDEYRELFHMHNDDSTLVIIEYDKKAEFDIIEQYKLDLLQENEINAEKAVEAKKKEAKELDENNWKNAVKVNTIESYQVYLNTSELKLHKKEAEKCIEYLLEEKEEQSDWDNASIKNSLESYSYYLKKHPQGKHSKEAEILIDNIKKSSGGARENGQNDPTEPSSEDDDRCGRVDNNAENSSLHNGNMENNSEISSTNSDPTSNAEGTEPASPTSSAEGAEPASPTSSAEGTEPASQPSSAEGTEPVSSPSSAEGTEPASPTSNAEGTEPVSSSSSAEGTEPASQPSSAEGTEPVSSSSSAEGTEPASQPSSAEGTEPASQPSSAEGTEPASSTSSAEGTEPVSSTSSAEGTEPVSSPSSEEGTEPASQPSSAEGTEPVSSTSGEEYNSTAAKRRSPWDPGYKKEVANQEIIVKNEQDVIIVPNSVDSSDGIDRTEFRDLFTTANGLFKKHREDFRKAFAKQKWSGEPEECFKKFWYELEEIIYNSNG